jgi:hypothetical protein
MNIKITCALYKLVHALKYLQCSEFFALRKSIVHLVFYEFIQAVNENFKNHVWWPESDNLL